MAVEIIYLPELTFAVLHWQPSLILYRGLPLLEEKYLQSEPGWSVPAQVCIGTKAGY